jgi:Holliday junction resolvasome RuvABC endonuclease subunit
MFLGIDQSLRSSGVAVISEDQKVRHLGRILPGKLTGVVRLAYIRDALREVLAAEPEIRFAALEGYAYDVGAGRVFELGEVGSVVKLTLHDSGVPFIVVPPASLKQFVSGTGQAKKEQMREAVLKKWGRDVAQDDECDALGLAQVARAFHLNKGTTRSELEVLKKLRDTDKKTSLVVYSANYLPT